MQAVSRFVGFNIILLTLLWGAMSGGTVEYFIDMGSLIFVMGVVMGGLWMTFGPVAVATAVCHAVTGRQVTDSASLSRHLRLFDRAARLAWGGGLVGCFISLIIMVQNMDDPSKLGPGAGICLLPVLYGICLAEFVFKAMAVVLVDRSDTTDMPRTPVAQS